MKQVVPLLAALILASLAALRTTAGATDLPAPLDLGAMLQPLAERNVFKLKNYFCWDAQLLKDDGKYYMVYSRWPKGSKKGGWLTQSEIALAVSEKPEGPYRDLKVLLRGRGPGHWDELMASNPKLYRFGEKYYLYYISSRSGPSWGYTRDSQRTGVAIADTLFGPYRRLSAPIVEPIAPVFDVTVNPAVAPMPDGRYLMMLKGDFKPKLPTDKVGQRVEGIAVADRPEGPFLIQPELAIREIDTEDPALWYDDARRKYFAIFHADTYIGLIESDNGFHWRQAEHSQVIVGAKLSEASHGFEWRLRQADGTMLHTQDVLQRPDVFIEDGAPRVLALSIPEEDDMDCVTIPLKPAP